MALVISEVWRMERSRPSLFSTSHFSQIMVCDWLGTSPTFRLISTEPAFADAGTTALTCNTPATRPGALPAYFTCAGWPSIVTDVAATGIGIFVWDVTVPSHA